MASETPFLPSPPDLTATRSKTGSNPSERNRTDTTEYRWCACTFMTSGVSLRTLRVDPVGWRLESLRAHVLWESCPSARPGADESTASSGSSMSTGDLIAAGLINADAAMLSRRNDVNATAKVNEDGSITHDDEARSPARIFPRRAGFLVSARCSRSCRNRCSRIRRLGTARRARRRRG